MDDLKVGDRLKHHSGSIWKIKEILSGSVVMGIGAEDYVTTSLDELYGYQGEMPFAQMTFTKLKKAHFRHGNIN